MRTTPRRQHNKIPFPSFSLAVFVLVILVLLVAASALKDPVSASLIKSGDKKLSEERFVEATVEYKKADWLVNSKTLDKKLELADLAQKDILAIESLIRERNNLARLNLLTEAKSVPENEYETVLIAKKMIESNEPMFALIAANTAVEMNRNYKDAWLYLGIAHLETAQKVKLTSKNRNFHNSEAKAAFEKAKQIDQDDEFIDKYLDQIKN